MSIIAKQFARPRGLLGHIVGRRMARRNGEFSRWVIAELRKECSGEQMRIVELGPGPGIGLEETLKLFPRAQVWGIDLSPEMLSQSRRRNLAEVRAKRLTLLEGDSRTISEISPVDVVVANHVLYFWHDPATEMGMLHKLLRSGGLVALGYQLRQHMPPMARNHFPRQGHVLYESTAEVEALLESAGFHSITRRVKGPSETPYGLLALATA